MTYTVNVRQTMLIDRLIEAFLAAHPCAAVDDALEHIFDMGIRAVLIANLERAIAARKLEE